MTKHAHLELDYHKWTVTDYHKLRRLFRKGDTLQHGLLGDIPIDRILL